MAAALMTTPLEHIERAANVAIDVGVRMGQRISHTRLRTEMHDPVEAMLRKERCHGGIVGQILPDELKTAMRLQTSETRFFETQVVVGVEVVETDHHLTLGEQAFGHVHADEARSAGDENAHVLSPKQHTTTTRLGDPLEHGVMIRKLASLGANDRERDAVRSLKPASFSS